MNVKVTHENGTETVQNVVGFRIDEHQNLIIWRGPPEGQDKGWTDVAFYKTGYWLSALRQETK